MEQLELLREDLAQCDEILLNTLLMRNRIVEQIMAYKEANNIPILQPQREARIEKCLSDSIAGKKHQKEIKEVYDTILRCSKQIQARKIFDYNIFICTTVLNHFGEYSRKVMRKIIVITCLR